MPTPYAHVYAYPYAHAYAYPYAYAQSLRVTLTLHQDIATSLTSLATKSTEAPP